LISTIILTKNEELNIQNCLDSLNWSDEIFIVDSGSIDRTCKIASNYNVKIYFNKFEGFGKQRNWALDNCPIKSKWVLFLDADEVATSEFRHEIHKKIKLASDDTVGFYCCWKLMLDNKWIKHSDFFPRWQVRILKVGMVRFKDFGHGQKEHVSFGKLGYIKEPYLHFPFNRGWTYWFDKHNKYSTKEAIERYSLNVNIRDLFLSSDKRTLAIKYYTSRLPLWPLIRFVYGYIIKRGFLDGKIGLYYSINMSIYEFLIQLKMKEIIKSFKLKDSK
jgi:glycosyltransferase involved in cell wall biosynthesis